MSDTENNKNFKLYNYQKYFIVSLFEILTMSEKKIVDLKLTTKSSESFLQACSDLRQGFSSESGFDHGRIIKKVYKIITQNLDKLYPDISLDLFSLKNNGSIITIIPGLNLGFVINKFTKEELDIFMGHFLMLYVSSVEMVNEVNTKKKNSKVLEILPQLKEKISKLGITHDGVIFNPYVGLLKDEEDYNIDHMYKNIENIKQPEGLKITSLLPMLGISESTINNIASHIKEQLKDVDEEDIKTGRPHVFRGTEDPDPARRS
jgi:hypothetical protein